MKRDAIEPNLPTFDTAPPKEFSLRALKSTAVRAVSASMLPLIFRVARKYLGGETIDDALLVAQRLAGESSSSTLGFWDTKDYTLSQVLDIYLSALDRASTSGLDTYLSIKPPALRFDIQSAVKIGVAAQKLGLGLHFDSHGPEAVEASHAILQVLVDQVGAGLLGTTIPGRWERSLGDADWAIARGLSVRVVKGQWPHPSDPHRDMREGFLDVVDRLSGKAPLVRVASHDLPLVVEAVARLRVSGTPLEVEQLLGVTPPKLLQWAAKNNVRVRVYIPFGKGYIPNAVGVLRRNPGLALKVIKGIAIN